MPGGQFLHFRDKMSLARDTGHRGSVPGLSRPFRDGWQAYVSCPVKNYPVRFGLCEGLRCLSVLSVYCYYYAYLKTSLMLANKGKQIGRL